MTTQHHYSAEFQPAPSDWIKCRDAPDQLRIGDEAETDFTKRGRRLHAEISNQISEIGVPIGSSPRMFKMLIPIAVMSISTFRECGTHEASERMKTLQQVHMFPTLQVYIYICLQALAPVFAYVLFWVRIYVWSHWSKNNTLMDILCFSYCWLEIW